jgi:hypothetical protein
MRGVVFDVTPHVRIGQENILAVRIYIKTKTPGAVTTQGLARAGPNGGLLGADNPTLHAASAGNGCRPSRALYRLYGDRLPALWRRCSA